MIRFVFFAVAVLFASPAVADDLKPMDMEAVDRDMLDSFFGPWQIQNADLSKTCDVDLSREDSIGGMAIGLGDGCTEAFPVMGDVAAWRLYENWTIVFVDAARKELIRFTSPDDAYVAEPEVDGIATIVQPD